LNAIFVPGVLNKVVHTELRRLLSSSDCMLSFRLFGKSKWPFFVRMKPSSPSFRELVSPTSSVEGGRLQFQLEEPGRFLLPPVQPNSIYPVKINERGGGRRPCDTIFAQSTLVPHGNGTFLRRSSSVSPQPRLNC
jgi:hypothetical protein